MAGRQSYFAEKRARDNNPNFFDRVNLDEIRKNVKRIIKDIKFDMILEQDYNYFRHPQVLQACISESQKNYESCSVISNALSFYINEYLRKGITPYPSTDVNIERTRAANEQALQNIRANYWYNIWQMFISISYGADPIMALTPIKMIENKYIADL